MEKETVIDHLIQLSTREGISMFPKMPRHFHRVIVKLIYKMLNCFVVFVIKDVQVRKKRVLTHVEMIHKQSKLGL